MKTPRLLIHGISKGGVHHYELAKYQCSWVKKRHCKGPERAVGHAMTGRATCHITPSVKKAFEILKTISSTRSGLGVSELARDLNMAKSTVHGITSLVDKVLLFQVRSIGKLSLCVKKNVAQYVGFWDCGMVEGVWGV